MQCLSTFKLCYQGFLQFDLEYGNIEFMVMFMFPADVAKLLNRVI